MTGIVTDSTADLPLSYYEKHDVVMVPLKVRFGHEESRDWLDIVPSQFYARLGQAEELPKTSQPSPAEFLEVYHALLTRHKAVISLHISSKLSGTYASARMAAQGLPSVKVIDTGLTSVAMGIVVDRLRQMRDAGAGFDDLVSGAEQMSASCRVFFVVDTLRYLHMGGRIGRAQALVGSVLKLRPVLTLADGEVAAAAKARGLRQAIEITADKISDTARLMRQPEVICAHAGAPDSVRALRAAVTARGVSCPDVGMSIGSVVGAYLGPGSFAVAAVDHACS